MFKIVFFICNCIIKNLEYIIIFWGFLICSIWFEYVIINVMNIFVLIKIEKLKLKIFIFWL